MPLTTLKVSNFVDDSVTAGKLSATGTASSSTYLRGDNTWEALSGLTGLYNASTQTDYTVTVASSKFVIDGVSQDTISMTEGYTYMFDVSDATNSGHVLRFATAADAAGSTEYSYGVKALGTPASAGAKVFFTVPVGAPGLFYYCTNHASMGGTANTTTATTKTVGDMWVDDGRLYLALTNTAALNNGVWTSAALLNYSGNDGGTYFGTSNSGAAVGRYTENEAFNSVSWLLMPDAPGKLSYIWFGACSGTFDAGLMFSGTHNGPPVEYDIDLTAKWDGAAWTSSNLLATGRSSATGFGTQSATMVCGGTTSGVGSALSSVESYDGDCWSGETAMSSTRILGSGGGTTASAIMAGGVNSSASLLSTVELWSGTAWSAGNSYSTARYSACNPGIGSATSFILTAGDTVYGTGGYTSNTQVYDSTAWTTGNNSLKSCSNLAGGGGTNTGIIAGGAQGGGTSFRDQTELYEIVQTEFIGT